jgi:hypothetical protein
MSSFNSERSSEINYINTSFSQLNFVEENNVNKRKLEDDDNYQNKKIKIIKEFLPVEVVYLIAEFQFDLNDIQKNNKKNDYSTFLSICYINKEYYNYAKETNIFTVFHNRIIRLYNPSKVFIEQLSDKEKFDPVGITNTLAYTYPCLTKICNDSNSLSQKIYDNFQSLLQHKIKNNLFKNKEELRELLSYLIKFSKKSADPGKIVQEIESVYYNFCISLKDQRELLQDFKTQFIDLLKGHHPESIQQCINLGF